MRKVLLFLILTTRNRKEERSEFKDNVDYKKIHIFIIGNEF